MKFSILALAAVVSLSAAQNLSGEPACATSCLISAISAAGCAPSDVPCQCNLSPAVVGPCLSGACNANDLNQALTVGLALCSSYSAAHNVSSTPVPTNGTTSALSTTATGYSNTTTVTARTTSFTSTKTAGGSAGSTPSTTSSKAGAPALVAGIGGVVGILGLVAAL